VKVTVVSPDEGRGVLQPHLDKLLPALIGRGVAVEFIGWDRRRRWPRRSEQGGVRYHMVLRGGGYSSRRLVLWMPVWYVLAALTLLRRPRQPDGVIMAMDFEGAAPAALAGRFRGHRFIYNCRDNISMRYRLPRLVRALLDRLDARVMARADAVIFPDESRLPDTRLANFVVVRNAAPEVEIKHTPDPERLTVYAMGNLRADRGIGLLLDAAEAVGGCRVLAAGKCRDPSLAARLDRSPQVEYRGVLSPREALELCGMTDVVFTFYEPSREINRRAVSNKWADAMMAARPILINAEVAKSDWVVEQQIGYACAYDKDELVAMLKHIAATREEARARGARGRVLWEAGYRWDVIEARIMALLERATAPAAAP
jgi:glycosyltransferase involved in cell wall biosynthesis